MPESPESRRDSPLVIRRLVEATRPRLSLAPAPADPQTAPCGSARIDVPAPRSTDITGLLERAAAGDASAEAQLYGVLYAQLHRRAERMMRHQGVGHTLQTTALLNEAFLRVRQMDRIRWADRDHFIGVAVRAMRSALVDHARAKAALKRGGDRERVELVGVAIGHADRPLDVLDLHDALERLEALDPVAAKVVELRFFGGLDCAEVARALDISLRSAERHWQHSRAWLHKELS